MEPQAVRKPKDDNIPDDGKLNLTKQEKDRARREVGDLVRKLTGSPAPKSKKKAR